MILLRDPRREARDCVRRGTEVNFLPPMQQAVDQAIGGARAPCARERVRGSFAASELTKRTGRLTAKSTEAKVGRIAAPRPLAPTRCSAGLVSSTAAIAATRECCRL